MKTFDLLLIVNRLVFKVLSVQYPRSSSYLETTRAPRFSLKNDAAFNPFIMISSRMLSILIFTFKGEKRNSLLIYFAHS